MHFLRSPWEPLTTGKGWGHVTRLKGLYTDGRRKTWIYEFSALANPWGQIKTSRIFFNKAWCSGSRVATLPEGCAAAERAVTGFKGICGVFWFDFWWSHTQSPWFGKSRRTSHLSTARWLRYHNDFAWHAKCNSEKMHNFESCHNFSLQRRMGRNTIAVYRVGTGVYTTSRPVGHTFRELWSMSSLWMGRRPRSTNRLE